MKEVDSVHLGHAEYPLGNVGPLKCACAFKAWYEGGRRKVALMKGTECPVPSFRPPEHSKCWRWSGRAEKDQYWLKFPEIPRGKEDLQPGLESWAGLAREGRGAVRIGVPVWPLNEWHRHHLRTCWMCKIWGPAPDLWNQELWGWSPAMCV